MQLVGYVVKKKTHKYEQHGWNGLYSMAHMHIYDAVAVPTKKINELDM